MLALPASATATTPAGKNGRITYFLDVQDIGLMNANGSGQTNLTQTMSFETLPVFSPLGDSIVFFRNDGATTDLWSRATRGGTETNLTNTMTPTEFASAFFPDGRKLVYSRQDGAETDLWTMNRDGSNQAPLLETTGSTEYALDVSADGRRILFARDTGNVNDNDIWVANADGTGARNLTKTPGNTLQEKFASFSPGGNKIVYDRCDNVNVCDVWMMDASGGNQHPVADAGGGVLERHPVFSPNGKLIAFSRCTMADCEIYTTRLDGSGPNDLTDTPSTRESQPDWESVHRCAGRGVTIVGDDGPDKIRGTKKADVIAAFGGNDVIVGRGGNDRICGGKGKDRLRAGKGRDRCKGGPGRDRGFGCERAKL